MARETQQQITLPLAFSALLRQWSRCSGVPLTTSTMQVPHTPSPHEVSTSIPIDAMFDVESPAHLHDVLSQLPLFPYMDVEVRALCRHASSIRDDDR